MPSSALPSTLLRQALRHPRTHTVFSRSQVLVQDTQMGDPPPPRVLWVPELFCYVESGMSGREKEVFLALGSYQLRLSDGILSNAGLDLEQLGASTL